jgi:uracil phosphoribosyltransferase
MLNILGNQNSIVNQYISELRDVEIQKDRLRFRKNLERLGEIFAYEISKHLPYTLREVTTPLGIATVPVLKEQPIIGTILRAGIPFHQGLLNIFDNADNAFISAYRKHHKDGSFDIKLEYVSTPRLDNRVLILSDPMLATGSSIVTTYKTLLERGTPFQTHIVAALASSEGVTYVRSHLSADVTLWVGAVDEELTAQAYIVPGLGDAGDLAYGGKF